MPVHRLIPILWDKAPLGIFGVAIWANGQERAVARITSAIPFLFGIMPIRNSSDRPPTITQEEIPTWWRRFTNDSELRYFQMLTGSELCDLDGNTYWIRNDDLDDRWTQVDKERWIHHERLCGFFPKLPFSDPNFRRVCATGGFSNSGPGGRFSGTYTTDGKPPLPREHYP